MSLTDFDHIGKAILQLNHAMTTAGLSPIKALVVHGGDDRKLEAMAARDSQHYTVPTTPLRDGGIKLMGIEIRPEYEPAGPIGSAWR